MPNVIAVVRSGASVSAILLDGAALAAQIRGELRAEVDTLLRAGVVPGLGTILVGDDEASAAYIGAKHRACEEVGIASIHQHLPAHASQNDILRLIDSFNRDTAVDAYLVQLPLPHGVDETEVLLAMDPLKDADGLHPVNLGKLVMGAPGPLPCTPAAILELLVRYAVPIEGRHVVIIGRGLTIGRPLALLLALKRPDCNAAVTVVHTGVSNIGDHTNRADIIVAAAGSAGLLAPEMVRRGAAVVGAGLTREGKRIVSDVQEAVAERAGWITPRLGGVGPMTVVMLLRNAVRAASRRMIVQ